MKLKNRSFPPLTWTLISNSLLFAGTGPQIAKTGIPFTRSRQFVGQEAYGIYPSDKVALEIRWFAMGLLNRRAFCSNRMPKNLAGPFSHTCFRLLPRSWANVRFPPIVDVSCIRSHMGGLQVSPCSNSILFPLVLKLIDE